jgi:hypothetical protein
MLKFIYLLKDLIINLIFSNYNGTFILKKYFSDKLILLSKKRNLIKSFLLTENLYFSNKSRKLNCLIEGSFLLENKKIKKKLNILLVCHEFETYIAEFLLKLGYDINLYFYDLKIIPEKLNQNLIKKINFIPIEDDIRNLSNHFDKPMFDYIFSSRAGIDRFNYDEMIEILNDLSKILLDESSYLISYVTSSFLTLEHMDLANKKSLDTTSGIKNNENLESKNVDQNYLNLYCENLYKNDLEYLIEITKHYKRFNKNLNHPWLSKFLDKDILTKNDISEISSSYTKNLNRIKSLNDISGKATLFATYFSNISINKSYFANYIAIKK